MLHFGLPGESLDNSSERCVSILCMQTLSWESKMIHVGTYDVYLDILLMVSISVIKYWLLRSGHRCKNGIFGPGSTLDPGTSRPGTQGRGPGDLHGPRDPGPQDPGTLGPSGPGSPPGPGPCRAPVAAAGHRRAGPGPRRARVHRWARSHIYLLYLMECVKYA